MYQNVCAMRCVSKKNLTWHKTICHTSDRTLDWVVEICVRNSGTKWVTWFRCLLCVQVCLRLSQQNSVYIFIHSNWFWGDIHRQTLWQSRSFPSTLYVWCAKRINAQTYKRKACFLMVFWRPALTGRHHPWRSSHNYFPRIPFSTTHFQSGSSNQPTD